MSTITEISGVCLMVSRIDDPKPLIVPFYCTKVCNQQQKQIRMPKPDDNDSGALGSLSTSLLYLHRLWYFGLSMA